MKRAASMEAVAVSLDAVVAAVEAAGVLACSLGPRGARKKSDGSWVTEADLAVGAALRSSLSAVAPSAMHLGEESGGEVGAGLAWVVDPIDGTTNFTRGDDRWCVSVALVDGRAGGRPLLGVIHQPTLGRTWAAGVEDGVPQDGPGTTGTLVGGRLPRLHEVSRWAWVLRSARGARSLRIQGAAALDLVDVASGRASRAVLCGASLWDIAAGWRLVEAAGGRVSVRPVSGRVGARRFDVVARSAGGGR